MIPDTTHVLEEDNVSKRKLPEKTTLLSAQLCSRDLTFKVSKDALNRVLSFHFWILLAIKGV